MGYPVIDRKIFGISLGTEPVTRKTKIKAPQSYVKEQTGFWSLIKGTDQERVLLVTENGVFTGNATLSTDWKPEVINETRPQILQPFYHSMIGVKRTLRWVD